jgi:Uncharacterized protein conserved in bacteria (DUF2064)
MDRTHTPTLLVFTLGAVRESARHALLPEGLKDLERGLRRGCLETALEAGRASGCRLEVCSPSPLALPPDVFHAPQAGSGFGPRLEQAMLDAFERGTGPLLVVGTDVPGLAGGHLARALTLLQDDPDRVVLGPSPDGGFYLLASSRPIPGLANAARWCRRDTLRSLLSSLRALGRPVILLDPLADLDRPADLERWLAHADERWRALVGLLQEALCDLRRPLDAPSTRPFPAFATHLAGRSPPVPCSL